MEFTSLAASSGPPKRVKNLPIIIKSGAPGGCPTSNLKEVVINSPQSQKLTVGSMVIKKTSDEIINITQPKTLLYSVYFFILTIIS
jgi:hypothetical protein